jgi:hypothetical protein
LSAIALLVDLGLELVCHLFPLLYNALFADDSLVFSGFYTAMLTRGPMISSTSLKGLPARKFLRNSATPAAGFE